MTDDKHYFCVEDTNVPDLNFNPFLPLLVPGRPLLTFRHLSIPLQSSPALLPCCQRLAWSPAFICKLSSKSSAEPSPSFCAGAMAECFHLFSSFFSISQGLKTSKAPAPHRVFILIDTALTLVFNWLALELLDLNGPQKRDGAHLLLHWVYNPDSL